MSQILFHYTVIFVEFAAVCLSPFTRYLFSSSFLHCKGNGGLAQLERKIWVIEQGKGIRDHWGYTNQFVKIVDLTQQCPWPLWSIGSSASSGFPGPPALRGPRSMPRHWRRCKLGGITSPTDLHFSPCPRLLSLQSPSCWDITLCFPCRTSLQVFFGSRVLWAFLQSVAVDPLFFSKKGDGTVVLFPSRFVLSWSAHNLQWDLWAFHCIFWLFSLGFGVLETCSSFRFLFIPLWCRC